MKFHGFALGHIEVEVEGRACDLHNFYVASDIHYALSERTLSLRFTPVSYTHLTLPTSDLV